MFIIISQLSFCVYNLFILASSSTFCSILCTAPIYWLLKPVILDMSIYSCISPDSTVIYHEANIYCSLHRLVYRIHTYSVLLLKYFPSDNVTWLGNKGCRSDMSQKVTHWMSQPVMHIKLQNWHKIQSFMLGRYWKEPKFCVIHFVLHFFRGTGILTC